MRAPIRAISPHSIIRPEGQPPAAHTIEITAKGSENSVCENITSSLNIFSLCPAILKAFRITIAILQSVHADHVHMQDILRWSAGTGKPISYSLSEKDGVRVQSRARLRGQGIDHTSAPSRANVLSNAARRPSISSSIITRGGWKANTFRPTPFFPTK
ncbi:hypothetical protein D3C71_1547750 [compost metagenome]